MSNGMIDYEVRGLLEIQRKNEQVLYDIHGTPIVSAMRDCVLQISGAAKKNLVGYEGPSVGGVDTGRLRASITPNVELSAEDVVGVVGSNVVYAPYVEYGTRPHWPPLSALEVWAERHGTTAYLVARAISRRGTIAKKFLENAFKSSEDWVQKRLERAVQEIINK